MIYQGKARHPVREAVLHCGALNTGQFEGMSAFQIFAVVNQWHKERGWKNGFGYHGLITPLGVYYTGRPYHMIGAHVLGHNAGKLGFLLVESRKIDRIGEFSDWFKVEQAETLRAVLRSIPGLEKVSGHNDYAPRLCPGFKVETSDWL